MLQKFGGVGVSTTLWRGRLKGGTGMGSRLALRLNSAAAVRVVMHTPFLPSVSRHKSVDVLRGLCALGRPVKEHAGAAFL